MQSGRPHRPFRRPGGFQSAATPVILRVRAASVNSVDYKIRSGKYPAVTESPSSRAGESIGEPEGGHQQHHGRIRASPGRKDRCGENIEVRDGEGSQILVYDRLG
jgi:hypothetical protein